LSELGLRDGRHLRRSVRYVYFRLEEDFDDGDAVQRLRFHVRDIVDRRRQCALAQIDDAVGHLFRGQPGVIPDHGDDRDIDIREDIGRHVEDGERTENHQQERKHSKRVGPS